jgi:hypothetical protein
MIIIMVIGFSLCDFSPPNHPKGGLHKGFYQIFTPLQGGRGAKLTEWGKGQNKKRIHKETHRIHRETQRKKESF